MANRYTAKMKTSDHSNPRRNSDFLDSLREYDHSKQTLESMHLFRAQGVLCDVTLVAGGVEVPAHKTLLASCSPYFHTKLTASDEQRSDTPDKDRIVLENIDAATLIELVEFMYTGRVSVDDNSVKSILPAAKTFRLNAVICDCYGVLRRRLRPSNCLSIRSFAEEHQCHEFVEEVHKFIEMNFKEVLKQDEFRDLSAIQVAELLPHDRFTPERMFDAVTAWMQFDPIARADEGAAVFIPLAAQKAEAQSSLRTGAVSNPTENEPLNVVIDDHMQRDERTLSQAREHAASGEPTRNAQRVAQPRRAVWGGSAAQLEACRSIINELLSKKYARFAWPFCKPVDVEGLRLKDYYDVIDQPMDLGTIRNKMVNDEYRTVDEFVGDVRLVFTNCYIYNPRGHEIVKMAQELEKAFLGELERMPPNLIADESDETSDSESDSEEESGSGSGSEDEDEIDAPNGTDLKRVQRRLEEVSDEILKLAAKSQKSAEKDEKENFRLGTEVRQSSSDESVSSTGGSSTYSDSDSSSDGETSEESSAASESSEDSSTESDSSEASDTSSEGSDSDSEHESERPRKNNGNVPDEEPPTSGVQAQTPKTAHCRVRRMSLRHKRHLALDINMLPCEQISEVARMITDLEPSMRDEYPIETEVDFESLSDSTLRKIEKYAMSWLKKSGLESTKQRLKRAAREKSETKAVVGSKQIQKESKDAPGVDLRCVLPMNDQDFQSAPIVAQSREPSQHQCDESTPSTFWGLARHLQRYLAFEEPIEQGTKRESGDERFVDERRQSQTGSPPAEPKDTGDVDSEPSTLGFEAVHGCTSDDERDESPSSPPGEGWTIL